MTHKLRIPHYFHATLKREMLELYASTAIADFAIAVVMLFEPIFLYSVLKFSVQEVLLFMGAIYAIYIVLIPLGAKITSRFGYEHGIFFSIPFQILYWIFLFGSQQNINLIYLAPIAYGIEKSLFWPAFHASVARFANRGQKGREFSLLYAIINLTLILGPFVGGLISERLGVRVTFIIAAVIYFCSFIPLFTTREVFVPKLYHFRDTWAMYKRFPKKFLGYLGFGEELLVLTVWPIFIYLVVKNYEDTGTLATLAALIATVIGLYVGKLADRSKRSNATLIKFGAIFYFFTWIVRFIANSFFSVFAVDSASRIGKDIVFIPLSAVTYERAESTHIMPYVVFFEQSLAIGKLLAVCLGLVVFAATGSFFALFVLAGLFSLLYILI